MFKKWLHLNTAPKYPRYIFHHIPKCGGSSVKQGLKKWFKVVGDYISVDQLLGNEAVARPKDLSSLNSSYCLCGHFESKYNYLFLRYPEILNNPEHYRLFTFLRDPLELRISLYYYEIKAGRRKKDTESLEEYLLRSDNYLAKRFPCDKDNYQQVLDRYTFIGFQEELQQSIDQLSVLFGKPKSILTQINLSPRDTQSDNLSTDFISSFKEVNRLDYLIYNYARKKFQRELSKN